MSATVPRQTQSGTADQPSPETVDDGGGELGPPRHEHGDVVVIQPVGQLDRAGVESVRHAALDLTGRAVVIDLTDCVLTDPGALADISDGDDGAIDLCFVSRRPTCRLLLARTGVTSRFAVFRQLEDALQARTFAKAGYGRGWRRR